MDYGFVPGRDQQSVTVRELLSRRGNISFIGRGAPESSASSVRNAGTVQRFTTVLPSQLVDVVPPPGPDPAGIIFIGTHGDEGYMHIPYAVVTANSAPELGTYDTIAKADDQNLCNLAAAVHDANTKIKVRGCNIGQSLEYTERLKESLGGQIEVSAPKHFHLARIIPHCGAYEGFCYEFGIYRKVPFTGNTRAIVRTAIVSAFQAETFMLYDSTLSIQNTWWESWIPTSGIPTSAPSTELRLAVPHHIRFNPPLPVTRGTPIETRNLRVVSGMFRIKRELFTWYKGGVPSEPSQEDMIDQLHEHMRNASEFQDESAVNPYAMHKRVNADTFDDFLDLFEWTVRYSSNEDTIFGTGTRFKYTAVVPITTDPDPNDLTKNHLIYNFYPDTNNPVPPVAQIVESDSKLFQIV